MKVLLTGAVGRLGWPTWRALVEAGHDVRATDLLRPREADPAFELADLRDRYAVDRLVRGVEAIVHLGNIPQDRPGRSDEVYANNTATNYNIIEAAAHHGVKQLFAASSIQVIQGTRRMPEAGDPPPCEHPYLPLDGRTPPNPDNAYALSKLALEEAMAWWAKKAEGRSAVAARFPALIETPRQRPRHRSEAPRAGYLLDEACAWLAMADAASFIVACLAAELPGYRCYLPAAAEPNVAMTPAELASRYFADVPCAVGHANLEAMVDISDITAETGWTPQWAWADIEAASPSL